MPSSSTSDTTLARAVALSEREQTNRSARTTSVYGYSEQHDAVCEGGIHSLSMGTRGKNSKKWGEFFACLPQSNPPLNSEQSWNCLGKHLCITWIFTRRNEEKNRRRRTKHIVFMMSSHSQLYSVSFSSRVGSVVFMTFYQQRRDGRQRTAFWRSTQLKICSRCCNTHR